MRIFCLTASFLLTFTAMIIAPVSSAQADCCMEEHEQLHINTRDHFWKPSTRAVDSDLEEHQVWLVKDFFFDNFALMMMQMTQELTAVSAQQTMMFGQFMDADHQMESTGLLQEFQAQTHQDLQPGEGMCIVASNTRSMAASGRYGDMSASALSSRMMNRIMLSGETASQEGPGSDARSRLAQFRSIYCSPADNNHGQETLCTGGGDPERINNDVNWTRMVGGVNTIDAKYDVTEAGNMTPMEQDIQAMASNLYASRVPPKVPAAKLSNDAVLRNEGDALLMDLRAINAKRSVAMNSFKNIMALKTAGAPEGAEFTHAVLEEQGLPQDEIVQILGEEPSLYAQMKTLAKYNVQNPNFISNSIDKPANIDRMSAAYEGIRTMVGRIDYESRKRTEMLAAMILETELVDEESRINSEISTAIRGAAEEN